MEPIFLLVLFACYQGANVLLRRYCLVDPEENKFRVSHLILVAEILRCVACVIAIWFFEKQPRIELFLAATGARPEESEPSCFLPRGSKLAGNYGTGEEVNFSRVIDIVSSRAEQVRRHVRDYWRKFWFPSRGAAGASAGDERAVSSFGKGATTDEAANMQISVPPGTTENPFLRNVLPLAIPATLYAGQNQLQIFAVGCLDASTYTVLMQTRIFFACAFSTFFLSRICNSYQLLGLSTSAAALFLLVSSFPVDVDTTACRLLPQSALTSVQVAEIATVYCGFVSGLSGVLLETFFKTPGWSFFVRNLQLSAFSILVLAIYLATANNNQQGLLIRPRPRERQRMRHNVHDDLMSPVSLLNEDKRSLFEQNSSAGILDLLNLLTNNFFHRWTVKTWLMAVLEAGNTILHSFVIKQLDIVQCDLAQVVALLMVLIGSIVLFHQPFPGGILLLVWCTLLLCTGLFLYNRGELFEKLLSKYRLTPEDLLVLSTASDTSSTTRCSPETEEIVSAGVFTEVETNSQDQTEISDDDEPPLIATPAKNADDVDLFALPPILEQRIYLGSNFGQPEETQSALSNEGFEDVILSTEEEEEIEQELVVKKMPTTSNLARIGGGGHARTSAKSQYSTARTASTAVGSVSSSSSASSKSDDIFSAPESVETAASSFSDSIPQLQEVHQLPRKMTSKGDLIVLPAKKSKETSLRAKFSLLQHAPPALTGVDREFLLFYRTTYSFGLMASALVFMYLLYVLVFSLEAKTPLRGKHKVLKPLIVEGQQQDNALKSIVDDTEKVSDSTAAAATAKVNSAARNGTTKEWDVHFNFDPRNVKSDFVDTSKKSSFTKDWRGTMKKQTPPGALSLRKRLKPR
ncbi:unnamed protein product [Amoebophrya sp. A120]|nr:unnamed protein product [Amoebophrya sp. A120]|eukprot:GSA120T00002991001.1